MGETSKNTQTYVEHLQGMVRFPTVSNVDPDQMDFAAFDQFHAYLEEIYPVLHSVAERKIIGRAGLLYHIKSPHPVKEPVLLMAHQDVVPVGDPTEWKYPPFSGVVEDGLVWGRGSSDCKSVILAELEAVEELLREGFVLDYDIYLAYGYNEEVQCEEKSAEQIVSYLKEHQVSPGVVFDEGAGIMDGGRLGYDGYLCMIALGEKAYFDFEIYKESEGGHSMAPGAGTALGEVCRAGAAIEANPLPYRLTPLVVEQLKAQSAARKGEEKRIYSDPERYFDELAVLAKKDKMLDAQLHTTFAITMARGSDQPNVLPRHASLTVNCRVLDGDNEESVTAHLKSILPEGIGIRKIFGQDPAATSSVEGRPYQVLQQAMTQLYGEKILFIPMLLPGGTDSRFYTRISPNVYRFSGFLQNGRGGGAHSTNENFPCESLESGVTFFKKYLRLY